MIKVTDERSEYSNKKNRLPMGPDHKKRKVFNTRVDERFSPVKTKIADPVHRGDGMVNPVDFPEPWNPMERIMNAPLNKISQNNEDNDLEYDRIF
jgi:hypothetical protein